MPNEITYTKYMDTYGIGFALIDYDEDATPESSLPDLLAYAKEQGWDCPTTVYGMLPVNITIRASLIDDIEERLREDEYAGDDYEMPEEGRRFLLWAFGLYNTKHATAGNRYATVAVVVPEHLRYKRSSK